MRPAGRLAGVQPVVRQGAADAIRLQVGAAQRAHHDHVPLPALGLVDGRRQHPVVCTCLNMACGLAAGLYARGLQAVQIWAAHPVLDAVEQQRYLTVLADDAAVLQKLSRSAICLTSSTGSCPCTDMTAE